MPKKIEEWSARNAGTKTTNEVLRCRLTRVAMLSVAAITTVDSVKLLSKGVERNDWWILRRLAGLPRAKSARSDKVSVIASHQVTRQSSLLLFNTFIEQLIHGVRLGDDAVSRKARATQQFAHVATYYYPW